MSQFSCMAVVSSQTQKRQRDIAPILSGALLFCVCDPLCFPGLVFFVGMSRTLLQQLVRLHRLSLCQACGGLETQVASWTNRRASAHQQPLVVVLGPSIYDVLREGKGGPQIDFIGFDSVLAVC